MIYQLFAGNLTDEARIDLPASKSLSNRALILKALSQEECQLSHLSDCDDTRVMLNAFASATATATIPGASASGLPASASGLPASASGSATSPREVNIGAAGTSMRFLTAYYATQPGTDVILTGSERMKQRPIQILVDALRSLGADIEYAENEGFPPLHIRGKQLEGGDLTIDGSTSSQYISALLMVAPTLTLGLKLMLSGLVTSRPYIEMTLSMMEQFGVKSYFKDNYIEVDPQVYRAQSYAVESDWSASSYWYEMIALARSKNETGDHLLKKITLLGLQPNSLQGDSAIAKYFEELGVVTSFTNEGAVLTLADKFLPWRIEWDLSSQPDLAQTLVVTLCALDIPFRIKGLHTLRIKETDRISALQIELKKCGYLVQVKGDDEMFWNRETCPKEDPVIIDTYEDHRMAMAFAPLAISMFRKYGSELDMEGVSDRDAIYINNPHVVSKSYPTYWNDMKQALMEIGEIDRTPDEYRQHRAETLARVARTHQKAKFILNTGLIGLAVLIILGILAFFVL